MAEKSVPIGKFYKSKDGEKSRSLSTPPADSKSSLKEDKEEFNMKVTCHSNGALSKKLGTFFNNPQFHDVTLKLPDREFKAHRLVLCVWSGFFKEKLQGPSKSRCPSTMNLDLMPEEGDAFEVVLRFMYTGEISPKEENVLHICSLAEKYKVKELRRLCEEWIGDDIGDHNIIAASSRLRQAEQLGLHHLAQKCRDVFCHYFTKLPEATWNSLSVDHLAQILDSVSIVAEDEWSILQRVEKWIENNGGIKKNLQSIQKDLLPKIRFKYMTATQLMKVRTSPMGTLMQTHFPGVVEAAFEFRALAAEEKFSNGGQATGDASSVEQLPRLYLNFVPPGVSNNHPLSFEKLYLGRYNSISRSFIAFDSNGRYSRENYHSGSQWHLEGEAVQNQKDDPWAVKMKITLGNREGKKYRIALMMKESIKNRDAADVDEPEYLVLVTEGEVKKDPLRDNEMEKVVLTTPPVFEKQPREVTVKVVVFLFDKPTSGSKTSS